VNGIKVNWELLPGVGRSMLLIQLREVSKADVAIEIGKPLPYYNPIFIEGNIDNIVQLKSNNARIIEFEDPQGVLCDEKIEKGILVAKLTGNKGFHTVISKTIIGKAPQWCVFRIKVNDPVGEANEEAQFVHAIPGNASWKNIDISSQLNADVTTIYQQKYLTPRPNTVSVRLGTDGYSPWTFPYWKSTPPAIKTDKVNALLDNKNRLITPQGVPFIWNTQEKNIAFTSLWDNYPSKIAFPINETGKAIYFLVSGSTNIMQCRIANAVIRINYVDGKTDSLTLIPPINYWNLSPIDPHSTAPGQGSRTDYTSEIDKFCMPAKSPETVQLGENCRAMLLNLKLRQGIELKNITIETLSQEVVVGLMGITIMK